VPGRRRSATPPLLDEWSDEELQRELVRLRRAGAARGSLGPRAIDDAVRRLRSLASSVRRGLLEREVADARVRLRQGNERLRHRIRALEKSERERAGLEAEREEQRRLEEVGRFAAAVADDFDRVLRTILARTALLQERTEDARTARDLQAIAEASERASALCQRLLTAANRRPVHLERVDLRALVEARRPLLDAAAGEATAVRASLGETGLVEADPGGLERVILELVSNARAAMPDGGTLTIETGASNVDDGLARRRALHPGPHAVLRVRDDGCGMTDEVRSRALEPFFTTRGRAHARGLGLSTTLGIVRQLGGSLHLASVPEAGTEVTVHLPRARDRA
jgi:signal transduction histidine kinase